MSLMLAREEYGLLSSFGRGNHAQHPESPTVMTFECEVVEGDPSRLQFRLHARAES